MYATKERGKIEVKGKGEMTTYWLENKTNRNPPHQSEVGTYQAVWPVVDFIKLFLEEI